MYKHYAFRLSFFIAQFDLKINVGRTDLYFKVQWFYLISWRIFDVWTLYFHIMSQYDLKFDFKIHVNVGHNDIYFMVQWFCLISLRVFQCSSQSYIEGGAAPLAQERAALLLSPAALLHFINCPLPYFKSRHKTLHFGENVMKIGPKLKKVFCFKVSFMCILVWGIYMHYKPSKSEAASFLFSSAVNPCPAEPGYILHLQTV